MSWDNDVYTAKSMENWSHLEAKRHPPWLGWPVIVILALTTLACGFFSSSSRSGSDRVLIPNQLPTFTPTIIYSAQAEQKSGQTAVVSPTLPLTSNDMAPSAPTNTPIPVGTPIRADPTVSAAAETPGNLSSPLLIALVVLNVRAGPGLDYEVVGQLVKDQTTQLIGQNPEGTWWQISYPPGSNRPAWVSADNQYSTVSNVGAVPVAQAPPSPTATATATATAIVQSNQTPTPTGTPIAQSSQTPAPTGTFAWPTVIPTIVRPANVSSIDI